MAPLSWFLSAVFKPTLSLSSLIRPEINLSHTHTHRSFQSLTSHLRAWDPEFPRFKRHKDDKKDDDDNYSTNQPCTPSPTVYSPGRAQWRDKRRIQTNIDSVISCGSIWLRNLTVQVSTTDIAVEESQEESDSTFNGGTYTHLTLNYGIQRVGTNKTPIYRWPYWHRASIAMHFLIQKIICFLLNWTQKKGYWFLETWVIDYEIIDLVDRKAKNPETVRKET